MSLAAPYQRITTKLKRPLASVAAIATLAKPTRTQQSELRASLRTIATVTAREMEKMHTSPRRAASNTPQYASSRFLREFGHLPGGISEIRRRKFKSENTCIDIARGIAMALCTVVAPERISVVRMNGPEQNHPSIILKTETGAELVVDNWGMDGRQGVYPYQEFKTALQKSIGKPKHPLSGLSNALGFQWLRDLGQAMAHEHTFHHGGMGLLNASAHENHGFTHLEKGNDKEAMQHANAALRHAPDSDNAHFLKGNVFFFKRQFRRAIRCYEKALELYPFHTLALENIVKAKRELKDLSGAQEALKKLEKIVNYEPRSKEHMMNLEAFLDQLYPDNEWEPKVGLNIRVLKK